MVSATVRLTRETAFGFELVRHPFEISVDGKVVGSVAMRETAELPVEPGRHVLRLRSGRRLSPERSFDATEAEVIRFSCHGAMARRS